MDVLTLVQINESYSREKHTRISSYQRRRYVDVGRHVQRKMKTSIQNTKTKTKPFTFCTCPDVSAGPSWNKTANEGAPRSCPGQK